MKQDMRELLARLEKVDPKTWIEYMDGMELIGSGFTARMVQETWLQCCIQRAIEAKRWRYITSTHYDALDRILYAAELRDHENFNIGRPYDSYESMASALLAAYLRVLEGNQ